MVRDRMFDSSRIMAITALIGLPPGAFTLSVPAFAASAADAVSATGAASAAQSSASRSGIIAGQISSVQIRSNRSPKWVQS